MAWRMEVVLAWRTLLCEGWRSPWWRSTRSWGGTEVTLSFRCPVVLWTEVTLALGDSLGWKMEVALELGIQLGSVVGR